MCIRIRPVARVRRALAISLGLAGPDPCRFPATLGRLSCATCHPARSGALPSPGQAWGGTPSNCLRIRENLKAHPKLAFEKNGYSYDIERKGDLSMYTVHDNSGELSLPIQWAFGLHMQTFVFDYRGRFYESMVSYYPKLSGLAITLGDEQLHPRNLVEAMGREMSSEETTICFGCQRYQRAVKDGKLTIESRLAGCGLRTLPRRRGRARGKHGEGQDRRASCEAGPNGRRRHEHVLRPVPSHVGLRGEEAGVGRGERAFRAVPVGGEQPVFSWATISASAARPATLRTPASNGTKPATTVPVWHVMRRSRKSNARLQRVTASVAICLKWDCRTATRCLPITRSGWRTAASRIPIKRRPYTPRGRSIGYRPRAYEARAGFEPAPQAGLKPHAGSIPPPMGVIHQFRPARTGRERCLLTPPHQRKGAACAAPLDSSFAVEA